MFLKWKVLVYFMALWSVLRPFGIFCGHLVYFGFVWYIFSRFGKLYEEKSGNTGLAARLILKGLSNLQFFLSKLFCPDFFSNFILREKTGGGWFPT
jgi:hypothetical protein